MAVTKQQKQAILKELVESFKSAKSVVFSQYQGTNVKNMRMLRKKLTEQKVDFTVARKTLIRLAAKEAGFGDIPEGYLDGPIGVAFANGDAVAPSKIIHDFNKETETVKIVGAIFEGAFMNAKDATVIASLPSREVLLGRLVGVMKSPISGFHGVLHGLLRNFVYTLSEVAKKTAPSA